MWLTALSLNTRKEQFKPFKPIRSVAAVFLIAALLVSLSAAVGNNDK